MTWEFVNNRENSKPAGRKAMGSRFPSPALTIFIFTDLMGHYMRSFGYQLYSGTGLLSIKSRLIIEALSHNLQSVRRNSSKLAWSHKPHDLMDAVLGSLSRHEAHGFTVARYENRFLPIYLDPRERHS